MDSLIPNNIYNPFKGKKKGATYTQEQLDFIKNLLNNEWSVARICSTYGLDKNAIKKRIKNDDWKTHKKDRENCLTLKELKEMKEMLDNGFSEKDVAEKFQVSLNSVLKRKANNKWDKGHRKKTNYSFDENYFDEIDSDEKAYWLGFLMADGYITTKRPNKGNENQSFGCTLSVKDITHLEKFRDSLKSNHPIHIYKKNNSNFERGQDTCRLLIGNQHTVDSLKKLGIVENKTFFCKMPNIKEEYKLSFIRGYSDGDGSLYIDKRGRFGWSLTGTKELLQEILKVLGKSELKMEQRWPERENNNWSVTIFGKVQVPMLLDKIYENATVYLDRKYEVYLKMKAWHKNNPHKNYKYYQKYMETQGMNG